MTILKDMHECLLLWQSLYDLTNLVGRNLILTPLLNKTLGRILVSVVGPTNLLCHRLISTLVLKTSYLKSHMILLILLCLAMLFNSPRLLLFSIIITIMVYDIPLQIIYLLYILYKVLVKCTKFLVLLQTKCQKAVCSCILPSQMDLGYPGKNVYRIGGIFRSMIFSQISLPNS